MGLGALLHNRDEHADAGGIIERARTYEVLTSLAFGGTRRRVFTHLAQAGARPDDAVLDVGCGTGYLTRMLTARVTSCGQVTGLDPSEPMIAYARRVSPDACRYVIGEAQVLPFPDASFDLVTSSFATHHIPADERHTAYAEIRRVLRPGGRAMIIDYRPPTGRLTGHIARAVAGPAMAGESAPDIAGLLTVAGFTVTAVYDLRPYAHVVHAAATGTGQKTEM